MNILPKRTSEELLFLKSRLMTIEDMGYVNAVSGYSRDEKSMVKFLIESGYCFGDAIYFFRKYLLGYMIGEVIIANTSDKNSLIIDMDDLALSPICENEKAKSMLETAVIKEQIYWKGIDDISDDINYFYNLGRLDASILEKNNYKYFAMMLSGAIPHNNAVKLVCEYLEGFYFERELQNSKGEYLNNIDGIASSYSNQVREKASTFNFRAKAENILQRCSQ